MCAGLSPHEPQTNNNSIQHLVFIISLGSNTKYQSHADHVVTVWMGLFALNAVNRLLATIYMYARPVCLVENSALAGPFPLLVFFIRPSQMRANGILDNKFIGIFDSTLDNKGLARTCALVLSIDLLAKCEANGGCARKFSDAPMFTFHFRTGRIGESQTTRLVYYSAGTCKYKCGPRSASQPECGGPIDSHYCLSAV